MAWFVLVLSAVMEAVWATALGRTQGFTAPVAIVVFVAALVASTAGLGWAAQRIPIGSAYAVWTGLGAALTVGFAMISGDEAATPSKVLFLAGIIIAVVGLKLLPTKESGSGPSGPRRKAPFGSRH
jgi:quaternary ammonium compound-resistance protein SugE